MYLRLFQEIIGMRATHFYHWVAVGLLIAFGSACQSRGLDQAAEGSEVVAIQLSSSAFRDGDTIPKKYTCDGEDISPQLSWSGLPQGTQSLALIVDDPDAPAGTWVHWVLYDISPDVSDLPEDAQGLGIEGKTSFRDPGYGGPCPPKGKPHRYFFKLYALDKTLGLKPGATKADLEKAMQSHILAQGRIMGTYGR
jgi:Raf kinase inhibitor-like YbhB/YbcL family protein